MDSLIIFARWHQCALPSSTCFLGPTRVHIVNSILIGSAVFCTTHSRSSLYFTMGRRFPLKISPLHRVMWNPAQQMLLWAHLSPQPKRHLNHLSRFCRVHVRDRDRQINRRRDHATLSVTISRIYIMLQRGL